MRRSSPFWLSVFAVAFLAGCGAGPKPLVYVDVAAAQSAPFVAMPQPKAPTVPAISPGKSFSLPAQSATRIAGQHVNANETADRLLQENRRRALVSLENQLREVYLSEAARRQTERLAALAPARDKAASDARTKFLAEFLQYAKTRSPLVARLALIAGLPDPDPKSRQAPGGRSALADQWVREAKDIRERLAAMDREFEAKAGSIYRDLGAGYDAELTRLLAQAQQDRLNAMERARSDAQKQIRSIEASLDQGLAAEGDTILPAQPKETYQGALKPFGDIPRAEARPAENDPEAIRNELQIWLAINGYRLATSRSGVPDRTQDFLEWRNSRHPGP